MYVCIVKQKDAFADANHNINLTWPNLESWNSLKHSFINIWDRRSNFLGCESFLESNSPGILTLYETNLDDSNDCRNFSLRSYLPLIRMDFVTHNEWSCSLYEGGTAFCTEHVFLQTLRILICVFNRFYFIQCLLFFPLSITIFGFAQFFMLPHLT